jgi:Protein of unknown function (DUF3987)
MSRDVRSGGGRDSGWSRVASSRINFSSAFLFASSGFNPSPRYRELWIAFHDTVERSMRPDGPLAALRDVAGKAAEQAGRIAGVLQIIDDVSASAVEADAMTRGCELATWYLDEAARLASESLVPPVVRDAQTLLAWLHGHHMTTVTAATLQKSGPRPLRFKARLDPAINVLVEHGWLISSRASLPIAGPSQNLFQNVRHVDRALHGSHRRLRAC